MLLYAFEDCSLVRLFAFDALMLLTHVQKSEMRTQERAHIDIHNHEGRYFATDGGIDRQPAT